MIPQQRHPRALGDEELCTRAAAGDRGAEEALVLRYNRLVRMCARPYFLAGGDSEDLIQEGMLGLLSAIREYDPGRSAAFRTYAEVCIKNRLYSAVKAASRNKHTPLNRSLSIETSLYGESGGEYARGSSGGHAKDPEEILLDRESFRERLEALMGQLSRFETGVLRLYLSGLSYTEIAVEVNKSPKAVDNAVQRIRRKLAQRTSSGDISVS